MDFERLSMIFSMQEPYYGIILSSMNKIPDPGIGTMGVGRDGNVFELHYDPEFVNRMSEDTLLESLKHEMLHVLLNHFSIFKDKPDDEDEQELRNIALDLEVNCYLNKDKITGIDLYWPNSFGWDDCLGAREYYNRLKKINFKPPKPPAYNHSLWPSGMTEAEAEILQQTIEDMMILAAEEVEKGRGTIPGCLVGKIESILSKRKPKPVADWKRYFRKYVGHEFSELIRKSKKRESRRFPGAPGNRHQYKSYILVAVDTSGSVSMPEYIEFFEQIKTLTAKASFRVIECDTVIQKEYEFRNSPNMEIRGGGGTNFEPVIKYYLDNRKKFDAVVYFTDGEAPIPENTPGDMLWVISSKGDKNENKYRVNGAKVVFIPEHND